MERLQLNQTPCPQIPVARLLLHTLRLSRAQWMGTGNGHLASFHHSPSLPPSSPIGVLTDLVLVRLYQSSVVPLRGTKASLPPSGRRPGQPGPQLSASAAPGPPVGSSFAAGHHGRLGPAAHSPPASSSGSQLPGSLPRIWGQGPSSPSDPCLSSHALHLGPTCKGCEFWAEGLGSSLSDSADIFLGLLFGCGH